MHTFLPAEILLPGQGHSQVWQVHRWCEYQKDCRGHSSNVWLCFPETSIFGPKARGPSQPGYQWHKSAVTFAQSLQRSRSTAKIDTVVDTEVPHLASSVFLSSLKPPDWEREAPGQHWCGSLGHGHPEKIKVHWPWHRRQHLPLKGKGQIYYTPRRFTESDLKWSGLIRLGMLTLECMCVLPPMSFQIEQQDLFDEWVSKLRHHRIYRQNEIATYEKAFHYPHPNSPSMSDSAPIRKVYRNSTRFTYGCSFIILYATHIKEQMSLSRWLRLFAIAVHAHTEAVHRAPCSRLPSNL